MTNKRTVIHNDIFRLHFIVQNVSDNKENLVVIDSPSLWLFIYHNGMCDRRLTILKTNESLCVQLMVFVFSTVLVFIGCMTS